VLFGVLVSKNVSSPLKVFYTLRPFQWCRPCVNWSVYAKVMSPASFHTVLTTMVRDNSTSSPITRAYGASLVCDFKNIIEGPKPYHNLGLGKSKTYP
jgi:hypothetical protein